MPAPYAHSIHTDRTSSHNPCSIVRQWKNVADTDPLRNNMILFPSGFGPLPLHSYQQVTSILKQATEISLRRRFETCDERATA